MGTGIGIVACRHAGLNVTFVDPSEKSLLGCEAMIGKWCDKEIKKERMTEDDKVGMLSRISYGDTI